MTDFSSGRTVYNSSGGYTTQYDDMDEGEWVLKVYRDFLKKENFLIVSGDGSPETVYRKGSVYAVISIHSQRDDGLIPFRMIFSRDLDMILAFIKE
jgi:hypothetical protein